MAWYVFESHRRRKRSDNCQSMHPRHNPTAICFFHAPVSPIVPIAAVAPVRPGVIVSLNKINTALGLRWPTLPSPELKLLAPQSLWPAPTPLHTPLRHRPRQPPQASPSLKISLKANPTLSSTATATIKIDPTIKNFVAIDSFIWTS